jgi:hypothetical protein
MMIVCIIQECATLLTRGAPNIVFTKEAVDYRALRLTGSQKRPQNNDVVVLVALVWYCLLPNQCI